MTNKTTLIAALSLPLSALSALATAIDLGPSHVFTYGEGGVFTTASSLGLDGRAVNGHTISYDITFGGNFVRAFTDTGALFVRTDLTLAPGVPIIEDQNFFLNLGTGYFLNKNGGKASHRFTLEGGFEGYLDAWDLAIFGGLQLSHRPRDVYGFHFDLNFDEPNYSGVVLDEHRIVTNSFGNSFPWPDHIEIGAGGRYRKNSIFGVGPKLPADIIPEFGSTAVLLATALVGMAWFNWKRKERFQAPQGRDVSLAREGGQG